MSPPAGYSSGYPGAPPTPYGVVPASVRTDSKAIVGLVLSISSWLLCPVILAVVALVLAAGSLLRSVGRAKADMHTENHNHFNGPVTNHTEVHTSTKGMFGRTQNHNG